MTDAKGLLQIRKANNKRRPKFLRQDYHHRKKVQDDYWRAPKGSQSKMREKRIGHRAVIKVGYRNPAAVRNLHWTGMHFTHVHNMAALDKINPAAEIAIISGKLGAKKKYEVVKRALEKKISISGMDVKKFVEKFESAQKAKREAKAAKKVAEVKAKEEAAKTAAKPAEKPKEEAKPVAKPETKPQAKKGEAK